MFLVSLPISVPVPSSFLRVTTLMFGDEITNVFRNAEWTELLLEMRRCNFSFTEYDRENSPDFATFFHYNEFFIC